MNEEQLFVLPVPASGPIAKLVAGDEFTDQNLIWWMLLQRTPRVFLNNWFFLATSALSAAVGISHYAFAIVFGAQWGLVVVLLKPSLRFARKMHDPHFGCEMLLTEVIDLDYAKAYNAQYRFAARWWSCLFGISTAVMLINGMLAAQDATSPLGCDLRMPWLAAAAVSVLLLWPFVWGAYWTNIMRGCSSTTFQIISVVSIIGIVFIPFLAFLAGSRAQRICEDEYREWLLKRYDHM